MKAILKKTAGIALIAALALAMIGCANASSDNSTPGTGNDTSSGVDYSACVVGDFILKDGSVLSKDETPTSGNVAAVIVRAKGDGKPALGVGIVHSTNGIEWCTSGTGLTMTIGDLIGDAISGLMDGSNSWEILKRNCSDANSNRSNYPAWNYCLNYASNQGLTGNLAEGWYLPAAAELKTISNNKDIVDASLLKAGGTQFGTKYYWTCNEQSTPVNARFQNFNTGGCIFSKKQQTSYNNNGVDFIYVCAVKAFN